MPGGSHIKRLSFSSMCWAWKQLPVSVAELFALLRHKIVAMTSHNTNLKAELFLLFLWNFTLIFHRGRPSPHLGPNEIFALVSHLISAATNGCGHMAKKPVLSLCLVDH